MEAGDLRALTSADADCLVRIGIGATKRATLLAVAEVACRLAAVVVPDRSPLERPDAVASYLDLRYGQLHQEIVGALYLDSRNRLLTECEHYRGTVSRSVVEPRAVLREGLMRALPVWFSSTPIRAAGGRASDGRACRGRPIVARIAIVFAYLEAFVMIGLRVFATLVALALAWGWYRLLTRRERAAGVVVEHAQGQWRRRKHPRPAAWRQGSNTAVVAFTAADDTEYEVPFHYQSGAWDDYAEGQRVTVAYQRSNPRNAVVDEGRANYTDMIFATAVVVVVAVWYAAARLF